MEKIGLCLEVAQGPPKFGKHSGSWSWCLPVASKHCLGLQEGQILPYSKGFR